MTDKKEKHQSEAPENDAESDRLEPGALEREDPGDAATADSAAASESQPKKRGQSRKLSKKEVLGLLAEKNEKLHALAEKNAAFEAEIKTLKDRWLRSAADFENYRKRTRKEWDLLQQQAKGEVILEILDVVDDFERAFSVVGDRDDEFVKGMRLILNNLIAALEKLGVTRIDALDSPFDPNYHMAVAHLEREGAESDRVIEIVQNGYLLGETVIRPAKVVIAK